MTQEANEIGRQKESVPLAQEFAHTSLEDWRRMASETLAGRDPATLGPQTFEGLEVPALLEAGAATDRGPAKWRQPVAGRAANGWDIRQVHAAGDLDALAQAVLDDLEGGVTSIELRLDDGLRAGRDLHVSAPGEKRARVGAPVYDVSSLGRVLEGVYVEAAAIALDAGSAFAPAAAMLEAVWSERGIAPEDRRGSWNADPLGELARTGELAQGIERARQEMAALAVFADSLRPNVQAVRACSAPYHLAGAGDAQELGCLAATALSYLRVLVDGGLPVERALRQITLRVSVGPELFGSIAKLRALRLLWEKLATVCGVDGDGRRATIEALSSERMLSRVDPWVNLLRVTAAGLAAAIGGADRLTTLSFDSVLANSGGATSDLGRRVARNTQHILIAESGMARVFDPAGGAVAIEAYTEELGRGAWQELLAIEASGGMQRALSDGSLASRLRDVSERRQEAIARRKVPLTGVSEFAALATQPPPEPPAFGTRDHARRASERAARSWGGGRPQCTSRKAFEAQVEAMAAGATLGLLSSEPNPTTISPLPAERFAEPFERLRARTERHRAAKGSGPRVFLANLGPGAAWSARAGFTRNLLGAAGIATVGEDGYPDASALAQAFSSSGCQAAVLCSSDELYERRGRAAAEALAAAGAAPLYLAGRASALAAEGQPSEEKVAGLFDQAFHLGIDVEKTLAGVLSALGVEDHA